VAFDHLVNTWLPNAAFTQAGGAVFETYPEDSRNDADNRTHEIWVPVKAKP
jgi:predicted transcriptional regulator YdeE